MKKPLKFLCAVMLTVCPIGMTQAWAISTPIDLNDFFSDPTVIVEVDGSSAKLSEDLTFAEVILSNDPFLGDPEVIIAAVGRSLKFDFDFMEGAGNDDEFGAFIIDPATGGSLGTPFEFFTSDTSSGTVTFDLSSLTGTSDLGLQFDLLAFDFASDSMVTVSNVRLVDPANPPAIPEPSTILLFGTGIAGLAAMRYRKNINA